MKNSSEQYGIAMHESIVTQVARKSIRSAQPSKVNCHEETVAFFTVCSQCIWRRRTIHIHPKIGSGFLLKVIITLSEHLETSHTTMNFEKSKYISLIKIFNKKKSINMHRTGAMRYGIRNATSQATHIAHYIYTGYTYLYAILFLFWKNTRNTCQSQNILQI